jgi:predicted TIM-barrel fold metal-dependent hydrolase
MPPEIAENTSFFKAGWSDINRLLNALDKSGIEKAVLLYPTSDAHLNMGGFSKVCAVYNREISRQVNRHPDRLIGAGILPVDEPRRMLEELKRTRELGLSGISLASSYNGKYLDDEAFVPVLETAEKEKLPLFVHSQIINPIGLERVNDALLMPVVEYVFDITMCAGKLMMSGRLRRFKGLKIIFAHFAGVLPFLGDRFDATYSMLRARNIVKDLGSLPSAILKNIFVDTGGAKSISMLNMALEFFGPERILWGSDFPAKRDLKTGIEVINNLGISSEGKQAILGVNLVNMFG